VGAGALRAFRAEFHQKRTGLPHHTRLTVNLSGKPITVAASHNGTDADELVLLIHGLGCDRTAFDPVYTARDDRHWLAIDLPGHGDSPSVNVGRDLLTLYADVVIELVAQLAPRIVHIVGHSMGAAIGLVAAPALPAGAFVSIEGNLTGADCGLVSRTIAAQTWGEFSRHGFTQLRDELLASDQTDLRIWGASLDRADPNIVWEAAKSLVTWCDAGILAARWPYTAHRTYLWGERSGYPEHLRALLTGSAVHEIPVSAHFPMVDNPIGLADAIGDAIDGFQPETGTA
jgi:pimeloyl-ACP methyl ester carboxylesterase